MLSEAPSADMLKFLKSFPGSKMRSEKGGKIPMQSENPWVKGEASSENPPRLHWMHREDTAACHSPAVPPIHAPPNHTMER